MIKRTSSYGGILHEVVEHNGVLYLSGLVADALTPDITAQTADIMRQLQTLLVANGSSIDNVLQATVYLSELSLKSGFNDVWQKTFTAAHLPARAAIGVADLGKNVLVEMVVIAAKS
jgi:enamine deaminase RidA (YjgF/YER057c/UK114 family)